MSHSSAWVWRRTRAVVVAALALGMMVGVTACGPGGASKGPPSTPAPASSVPSQPASSQPPSPQPSPSQPSTAAPPPTTARPTPPEQTISGVIIEGTRPSCRVLAARDRRYALTGPGTERLLMGQHVAVTGTPRPDLVGPCGPTFVVTAIQVPAPQLTG